MVRSPYQHPEWVVAVTQGLLQPNCSSDGESRVSTAVGWALGGECTFGFQVIGLMGGRTVAVP